MNFSKIARQLNENAYKQFKKKFNKLQIKDPLGKSSLLHANENPEHYKRYVKEYGLNEGESLDAAASAAEKATAGGQTARDANTRARDRQKAGMAQQRSTVTKSDVSYASEEARVEREYDRMLSNQKVDWRTELNEALNPNDDPNHPFVDVMPFMDQKQNEAKKQMKRAVAKGAADQGGHHEAGDGETGMKESALNPFQVHFDKDGKSFKSKGSKESRDRIAKNIASNRKSGPMAQDPYKPRAGESD